MTQDPGIGRLIQVANAPGALLVRASALFTLPYLVFAIIAARVNPSVMSTILLVIAVVLAAGLAFFAWRRDRLSKLVDEAEENAMARAIGYAELTSPSDRSAEELVADRMQQMLDFEEERHLHKDTWMPRVEATQRALVRAAGGVQAAPYLKDDLRVTLISMIVSVAAIPASAVGSFLSLLMILG
ncbi:MAG TPA: hypothetical protein VFC82_09765 [Actinomycetaceae bacterium]|nr:hypothetical protein [Actinomycetaceae bacterium]